MLPLILAVLGVKRTQLQRPELQCESWAKLLQRRIDLLAFFFLLEDVSMVSEEDKVALVVQCDDLPTAKLRIVREETSEHSSHPVAKPRVEVVEDELRPMTRGSAVTPEFLGHNLPCKQGIISGVCEGGGRGMWSGH